MSSSKQGRAGIAPWLSVRNASQAAAFYKAAFGAAELYRLDDDNGKLIVGEMSVGGANFWIQDDPDCRPETAGRSTVRMILTVDDPDAMFVQAIGAGASEIFPVNEEHGWRTGRLTDPFGYHW
jgi:PhnB protein